MNFNLSEEQRVLLFLFLNEKGSLEQLKHVLKISLTPIRTLLLQGKVISTEKSTYRLNPSYSRVLELEEFLKRTYLSLNSDQRKLFSLAGKTKPEAVLPFWERLKTINQFHLLAKSRSKDNLWQGSGSVQRIDKSDSVLIFQEKGTWRGKDTGFSNVYRWKLNSQKGTVSLEHLRFGLQSPVYFFDLIPIDSHHLASVDSHLCHKDVYLAQVFWDQNNISLSWRIIGPEKNEEIRYSYF